MKKEFTTNHYIEKAKKQKPRIGKKYAQQAGRKAGKGAGKIVSKKEKEERKRLLQEGLQQQGRANLYEAQPHQAPKEMFYEKEDKKWDKRLPEIGGYDPELDEGASEPDPDMINDARKEDQLLEAQDMLAEMKKESDEVNEAPEELNKTRTKGAKDKTKRKLTKVKVLEINGPTARILYNQPGEGKRMATIDSKLLHNKQIKNNMTRIDWNK